jgi:hypothetical protein
MSQDDLLQVLDSLQAPVVMPRARLGQIVRIESAIRRGYADRPVAFCHRRELFNFLSRWQDSAQGHAFGLSAATLKFNSEIHHGPDEFVSSS